MDEFTGEQPPRFLCDEMLGHLARYLRAAGHDVILAAAGTPDGDLLRQARAEGRLFITCDRGVAHHRAAVGVALILPHGSLAAVAGRLGDAVAVDWLRAPFTRCLVDNGLLRPAGAAEREGLPADLAEREIRCCPVCGRRYWFGAHCRRLRLTLEALQAAASERRAQSQAKPGSQPERG